MKDSLSYEQYAAWCRMSAVGPHFPAGRDASYQTRETQPVTAGGPPTEAPSTLRSAGGKTIVTPNPKGSQ